MNPYSVDSGLPVSNAPLEWATVGNGLLFTAQIPIDAAGEVVAGGIEAQTRQLLANLDQTLQRAGTSVTGLTQVIIYVTDRDHLGTVNRLYADFVRPPWPNRAAIIVSGFARESMLVEMLAYAVVPNHDNTD